MSALDHHAAAGPAGLLSDGTPVSVHRGRSRDLEGLRGLAARSGVVCDELELARLLRSDPSKRLILCATIPLGDAEALVGFGVIELSGSATVPSLILVDPARGIELGRRLAQALVSRARDAAA